MAKLAFIEYKLFYGFLTPAVEKKMCIYLPMKEVHTHQP